MKVLALVLAALLQVELWLTSPPVSSAVFALAALALAWARRWPLAVLVAIPAAFVADGATGGVLMEETGLPYLTVLVAAVCAGRWARNPRHLAGAAVAATGLMTLGNQLATDEYSALDDLVWSGMMIGTPTLLAWLVSRRAEVVAELDARSGALRTAQALEAEAAVAEERARLAVEVHDALAHRLGDMAMQAAGAERLAEAEPARALGALARIETSARDALDEIRRAIGVLRRDDGVGLTAPAEMPASLPDALPAEMPAEPATAATSRPWLDPAIAAAVYVAIAVETLTSSRLEGPAVANALSLAVVTAPLAWRTRAPVAATVALYAAAAVHTLLLTPLTFGVTPTVLLLLPPYSVAAHLTRRPAIAGLVACLAGSVVFEPAIFSAVAILLVWAGGRLVRDRGLRADELRRVNAVLEHAGAADAARARSAERLRVSRELHDAVAHRLTVIVLQAEAAQRVWDTQPTAARGALTALADVARGTLGELRVALEHGPTAGELDALLGQVRQLGVEVTVTGTAAPLDPVLFTVVREALTNAVRHAAPTRAAVQLRPDGVTVTDTGGPGTGVTGTGTGLRGLAERVAARGGVLRHGPLNGGYRVEARL